MGVSDSHLRIINDELVLDEVLKVSDNAVKENAFEAAAAADSEITPPEQFQNSFHQNEQTGKRKKNSEGVGGFFVGVLLIFFFKKLHPTVMLICENSAISDSHHSLRH